MLAHVLRSLFRAPGFTATVVALLGLGIGANAAVFSVVRAVLLRPMPYERPEQVVGLRQRSPAVANAPMSRDQIDMLRERAGPETKIEVFDMLSFDLVVDEGATRIAGAAVSPGLLPMLGVTPALGRQFDRDEDHAENNGVALISHALWHSRFGGSPDVIGREVRMLWSASFGPRRALGDSFRIVGVLPQDFLSPFSPVEVLVPHTPPTSVGAREALFLFPFARIPRTFEEAATALSAIVASMPPSQGASIDEQRELGVTLLRVGERQRESVRLALWVLLGAVGLLLLGACANVANLLLARNRNRRREIGLRLALGAGRKQLMLWLFVESALLAGAGAVLGLALAAAGVRFLQTLTPSFVPRLEWIGIDGPVLLFTLAVTVLTILVFGTLPGVRATDRTLTRAFGGASAGLGGAGGSRLTPTLVVLQVGLAVVLLVGAGLLVRSFRQLLEVDLGFDTERLLTFEVSLPSQSYAEPESRERFHREARAHLQRLPELQSVALSTSLPMTTVNTATRLRLPAGLAADTDALSVAYRSVSDDFFETMGVPLLEGRTIENQDVGESARVAVVNRLFAERYFPRGDALEQTIGLTSIGLEEVRIVGVVGNVRHAGPERELYPVVYVPSLRAAAYGYVLRARSAVFLDIESVQRTLAAVDATIPLANVRTFREPDQLWLGRPHANAWLASLFAALALGIALLGLLATLSFSVTQRRAELGLRGALGATPGDIQRMVAWQGLRLVGLGLIAGLIGSTMLNRLLEGLLFQVTPVDPLTMAAVTGLLLLAALPALLLPARSAVAGSPATVLRGE